MANPHKSKSQSFLNKKQFFIFLFSQFCTPCSVVAVMDLFHQTLLYDRSTILYEKLGRFNNKHFFIFVYCVVKTIQLLLDLTCEEKQAWKFCLSCLPFQSEILEKTNKKLFPQQIYSVHKKCCSNKPQILFYTFNNKNNIHKNIFSK